MFSKKTIIITNILLVLCFTFFGCMDKVAVKQDTAQQNYSERVHPDPCIVPTGTRLADVINQTKQVLKNKNCINLFDDLYDNILDVGKGDSKPENKALVKDFFGWCVTNGILSKNTAREYFGSYFSLKFVTLDDYPDICGQCYKIDKIIKLIEGELYKKRRGILEICEDKDTYKKAVNAKKQGLLILEATCEACRDH